MKGGTFNPQLYSNYVKEKRKKRKHVCMISDGGWRVLHSHAAACPGTNGADQKAATRRLSCHTHTHTNTHLLALSILLKRKLCDRGVQSR